LVAIPAVTTKEDVEAMTKRRKEKKKKWKERKMILDQSDLCEHWCYPM
jgi:hypothetical protein